MVVVESKAAKRVLAPGNVQLCGAFGLFARIRALLLLPAEYVGLGPGKVYDPYRFAGTDHDGALLVLPIAPDLVLTPVVVPPPVIAVDDQDAFGLGLVIVYGAAAVAFVQRSRNAEYLVYLLFGVHVRVREEPSRQLVVFEIDELEGVPGPIAGYDVELGAMHYDCAGCLGADLGEALD